MSTQSDTGFPDEYLRRALERGRLSHAYLLLGSRDSGRMDFATELSKRLFCEAGDSTAACGACTSCRSIDHDNHPGVTVFAPAEGKAVVDIDTIRTMCERSHYARDHAYVAILPDAETMTEPAANALLKTLEEPGGRFILVLVATSEGALLPTIVSRCHRIHFPECPRVVQDAVDFEEFSACERLDFWAQTDIRAWLERVVPDESTIRGRVTSLVDGLIAESRSRLDHQNADLLEHLLELRTRLDGNVNADLVLEQLLAAWRRRALS